MSSSVGTYLVLGFIEDNEDEDRGGVHTPLRSDGYYGSPDWAMGIAALWRKKPMQPGERVVVVRIFDDGKEEV